MHTTNNRRPPRRDKFSRQADSIQDILPSSEILEKFEDAVPGSVNQLISMAEKEQNQRHEWQNQYLKSHNCTTRIGQFCGLIYNVALLAVAYRLITLGEKDLALKLFFINATVMMFVVIVTTFERRVFSRRPRMRGRDDNRRRNVNRDNKENRRHKSS